MKYFTLFDEKEIHLAPNKKIIPAEDFSKLLDAQEMVEITKGKANLFREEVAAECEVLREKAISSGFEEGQVQWNKQIELLEKEIEGVRKEMENAMVPLALAAVKKIIGREMELKRETVVDIIATALKSVSQHRRITLYVNKSDLDLIEENRGRIKELFEHLETLSIAPRDDVVSGGCIIETEAGIINAQLESQLKALETAFHAFFQSKKKGSTHA